MQPTVGVILSDTRFRRPVGDVGNAASYSHPAIFHTARGVTAAEMVQPVPNMALLAQFPDTKAFVCECHDLPPFSAAIRRQTRKPVFDILTLVGAALRAQEPAEFS